MKQDIRFIMPIAENATDSILCWMVNGVNVSQNITITFDDNPVVSYNNINPEKVVVMKTGLKKKIGVSEFSEVSLPGKDILDRDEFRKLANEVKNSPEKIKAALKKR